MTWLGFILVGLYVFAIITNLIYIGAGGHTYHWTPGALVFLVLVQCAMLAGILFVGTGSI